jgi:protein-S-isoprenylcysteine O-methyltransferase Ste14
VCYPERPNFNMPFTFEKCEKLAHMLLIISWVAFAAAFIFRRRPEASQDRKRDSSSLAGVILQGLAYAIIGAVRRAPYSPILPVGSTINLILCIVAVVIAIGSVLLVINAVGTLGKEWSVTARVVEGHKLATEGPYSLTRNPIYTGMLGMLIATGLIWSYGAALVVGVGIFLVGTLIRVRSEERLLRDMFGAEFDRYKRRVPALIPGLFQPMLRRRN